MSNKLIKGIDEDTWRKFVAFCKLKNVKVGDQVNDLLQDFLNDNFDKLLRGEKK